MGLSLVEIVTQYNYIKVMIASLGSLPDLKEFKYDREQEETIKFSSGYSHNSLKSENSDSSDNPDDLDSMLELSILCYFYLQICNNYDEGIKVM